MSPSIVWRLVAKDLYLYRTMIVGLLIGSAVLLGVTAWSPATLFASSILLFCLLLIVQIFFVTVSIQTEKKEKALLFVLSLPVSPMQYAFAKVIASCIGFVAPWAAVTAASAALVQLAPIPDGVIPFVVTISTYLLAYHFVLLAAALLSDSVAATTTVIIAGNILPSFLIPFLLNRPSIQAATAAWPADYVWVLATEIIVAGSAIAVALYMYSRKKDFI